MLDLKHRFVLEPFGANGNPLQAMSIAPDWGPAEQCARFAILRSSGDTARSSRAKAALHPLFASGAGEGRINGFELEIVPEGGEAHVESFGLDYFIDAAWMALESLGLVEDKGATAPPQYTVSAFPLDPRALTGELPRFRIQDNTEAPELLGGQLDELLQGSRALGSPAPGDMPVFVPESILDEIAALSLASEDRETGGFLIGHLCFDAAAGEVFPRLTQQLPMGGGRATSTSLSFAPEAWANARASLGLRGRGEVLLGTWHSHPVREWCRKCPEERRSNCHLLDNYFSSQDHAMHRASFPQAYGLAMVVNVLLDGEAKVSLYGWRQGRIEQRAFELTGGLAEQPAPDAMKGVRHAGEPDAGS